MSTPIATDISRSYGSHSEAKLRCCIGSSAFDDACSVAASAAVFPPFGNHGYIDATRTAEPTTKFRKHLWSPQP